MCSLESHFTLSQKNDVFSLNTRTKGKSHYIFCWQYWSQMN